MIAIVDYEMGNLRSVAKALERVGFASIITSERTELERADKLVLPGVGAFSDAMAALRSRNLVEPLRDLVQAGKPTLGICLGMQLLFERSWEDGEHEGLGLLAGDVVRFALPQPLKVPHMGWNSLDVVRPSPLTNGIAAGSYFYFVHSYHVRPSDTVVVAATADYGGPFCASVRQGNLYATQFHPEKSQGVGLQMLRNFAELA